MTSWRATLRRRVGAVSFVLVVGSCDGRSSRSEGDTGPDAGATPQPIRCSAPASGELSDFDVCFGYRGGEPPFVYIAEGTRELDIDVIVVNEPEDPGQFVNCVPRHPVPTLYLQGGGLTYSVSVFAERVDGYALPELPVEVGEVVRLNVRTDGNLTSAAIRVDAQHAHLAATRYGFVLPPVTEFRAERGPSDGEPEANECGMFQDDMLRVTRGQTEQFLHRGECSDLEGVAFLFLRAFRPVGPNECTDQIAPISWIALWGTMHE